MDNELAMAKSLSWTYMIQDNTFARVYKDTLSDFPTWVKKENVDDGILIAKNSPRGSVLTSLSSGMRCTRFLHNKDAHGKKALSLLLSRAPTPRQLLKS